MAGNRQPAVDIGLAAPGTGPEYAKIFPAVEKASDEPTADLLTQRLQVHEKTAWMLRSLPEA